MEIGTVSFEMDWTPVCSENYQFEGNEKISTVQTGSNDELIKRRVQGFDEWITGTIDKVCVVSIVNSFFGRLSNKLTLQRRTQGSPFLFYPNWVKLQGSAHLVP